MGVIPQLFDRAGDVINAASGEGHLEATSLFARCRVLDVMAMAVEWVILVLTKLRRSC